MYLLLIFISVAVSDETVNYLHKFGYIDDNALNEDIQPALKLFQEAFRLEPTGVVDNATIDLMTQPRCGNKDELNAFTVSRRWNTTQITWYYYGPTRHYQVVQKAFDVWGKHANIVFKRSYLNPTIIISFGTKQHYSYYIRQNCASDFDGPGLVLGHAFLPHPPYNQTDIHLDSEEKWDFTMNIPSGGNRSMFYILVHEIGHALGIGHSFDNTSVMFPYHRLPANLTNFHEFNLTRDDIFAIQYLYGPPPSTTTSTTTTTTSTTTTASSTSTTSTSTVSTRITSIEPSEAPERPTDFDICSLKNLIDKFVIVNGKIFAFYFDYVWVIDLDPSRRGKYQYVKPKIITDWLTFLPRNSTGTSAVYQGPNGDVNLFYGKYVYVIKYPSLTLVSKYPIEKYIGYGKTVLNAAISTNQGRTLIFTDNQYVSEFDECSRKQTFLGTVANILHGVPGKIRGAFRYINGRIYFLTDSSVLEYDEFTNTVTGSESDAFEVLRLSCMRDALLTRLYDIIRYLQ